MVIAFYVGLLLLLAWLGYFSPADLAPPGQLPTSAPPAPQRDRPGSEQAPAASDRTPKTRDDRRDPTAKRTDRRAPAAAVRPRSSPTQSTSAREQQDEPKDALLIHNVSVFDEDRRLVYRGDVDLAPTLERIERGERLRFHNDGIVFENRERRLPARPAGYYHEFVQPTPGVGGPGAAPGCWRRWRSVLLVRPLSDFSQGPLTMPARPIPQFEFVSDLTGFRASGSLVIRLPGRLRRKADLLRTLATQLKLPTYFGYNWDALEECLRDLSWLGATGGVVLLHEHLPLADDRQRQVYAQILRNAQTTGAAPLRVIFPTERGQERMVSSLKGPSPFQR